MSKPTPKQAINKEHEQYILNKSFDGDFDILAVEIVAHDGTDLKRVKVNSDGELVTSISPTRPTDPYGYQAKSTTATHSHYFFEDADGNWYIKRKTLATEVFDYTKGTGGYDTVFVDKDSAPSGTLTWGSFGDTF